MTRLLLFGYGNPGRGDDALGPMLIERIAQWQLAGVECQQDMQLQVEHVTDLAACDLALFIDADLSCSSPFVLSELAAAADASYTTHAMSPAALLHAYRQVYRAAAPPAFLLRIRGYDFELGAELGRRAADNLEAASGLLAELCADRNPPGWRKRLASTLATC